MSEWQQNNSDAHKPSYVKKPQATGRPTKSKQISMLVSQQVAAEIQKYTTSPHDRTPNPMADQDTHLKSIVQSAVADHFKLCKPARPPNWSSSPAKCFSPPANWGERVYKPT